MSAWLGQLALCGALVAAAEPARAQQSEGWDRYLGRPRGPYRGQVVDAETKAPLAGAVVVARWMRDRIAPLHLTSEHHAVREVVTDSEGRFILTPRTSKWGRPGTSTIRSSSSSFRATGRTLASTCPRRASQAESSGDPEQSSSCPGWQTHRTVGISCAHSDLTAIRNNPFGRFLS